MIMQKTSHPFSFILFLFLIACGSSSGVDPHLTIEEQEELMEVNLVGKWKIRPRTINANKKVIIKSADCFIEEIEFFEDRSYLFGVGTILSGDTLRKIYRGKYDLAFTETNNEVVLTKIVLMDNNYTTAATIPTVGSVATIDEITLTDASINFRLQLGQDTAEFCATDEVVTLSGDKEEPIAADAEEGSTHEMIQNNWRLIGVEASFEQQASQTNTSQDICLFFEEEFYERCQDEQTGELQANCPQAVSTTLLISGYGTYLFTYFDRVGQELSSEQGDWRWDSTAASLYSVLEVKEPNESFSDSATLIRVVSISETTLVLSETANETDEAGNAITVTFTYNFQAADLSYQNADCPDFTQG